MHYLIGQDPGLQKIEYWLAAEIRHNNRLQRGVKS